jgi:hypothetical protein
LRRRRAFGEAFKSEEGFLVSEWAMGEAKTLGELEEEEK